MADELVVFEPSQVLPLFLVSCKIDTTLQLGVSRKVIARPEWSDGAGGKRHGEAPQPQGGGQPLRVADLLKTPADF